MRAALVEFKAGDGSFIQRALEGLISLLLTMVEIRFFPFLWWIIGHVNNIFYSCLSTWYNLKNDIT